MDRVHAELAALKRRIRLQTLAFFGVLAVCATAMGGADAVARTTVAIITESDAWTLSTKDATGTLVPRIVATQGEPLSRLKIQNANLELAQQPTASLPSSPNEGALAYDSTVKRLKYFNGTTWIDTTPPSEIDTWRLVYTSASQLTLEGIGNGGGVIEINGALVKFTANPTLGLPANNATPYRIYAYLNGPTVALEASQTAATKEEYGVYATKTGDPTRRFVGLAYVSGGAFAQDMVRSSRNERGYSFIKNYVPASYTLYGTSSTTLVDIDGTNVATYGLFFDKERVTAWVSIDAYPWDLNITRVQLVGVWFDSADIAESLIGNILNRGSGGADPMVPMQSKGYATSSGAGRKIVKGRYKTYTGYLGFLYTSNSSAPVQTGFEIQH